MRYAARLVCDGSVWEVTVHQLTDGGGWTGTRVGSWWSSTDPTTPATVAVARATRQLEIAGYELDRWTQVGGGPKTGEVWWCEVSPSWLPAPAGG